MSGTPCTRQLRNRLFVAVGTTSAVGSPARLRVVCVRPRSIDVAIAGSPVALIPRLPFASGPLTRDSRRALAHQANRNLPRALLQPQLNEGHADGASSVETTPPKLCVPLALQALVCVLVGYVYHVMGH